MLDNMILDTIITKALQEDIGSGDITTNSTVPINTHIKGKFISKEQGIICGIEVVKKVFEIMNKDINLVIHKNDGDKVCFGDVIAEISGSARGILTGERVALNFLQRLSGIATRTSQFVNIISSTKAKIVDTRKTTPGLRILEKYAVTVGGGTNHRFNLSDGVLIKDNHIKAAGGITGAITAAKNNIPHTIKIEVETETLEQVKEALNAGADIIMLDNMDIETMKKAINMIDKSALVEASGNMDEKDLRLIAEIGVDLISIGALTHTVKSLDISLKF
jgi:nicotinate-nucleotide pyrophosphorylase (carboxylating)